MKNENYIYIAGMFIVGAILTMAFAIENIIDSKIYKETDRAILLAWIIAKSIIGGIVMVLAYYALQELKLEFVFMDFRIKLGEMSNLFLSSFICIFASDFYKATKRLLQRKSEVLK